MPNTKQPLKGSREEAEQKLVNLRKNLGDVVKKLLELEAQKQSILGQITYWKKELASRRSINVDAIADALFEQCGEEELKELKEVEKKKEEH